MIQLREKVDLHAHYLPKTYKKFLREQGNLTPDNFPTPIWTVEKQLIIMKELNIKYAVLSISSPPINMADDNETKEMVRNVNIEGSKLVQAYPDKLGFVASLPMPNVEYSIEEASYAINELGALGIGVTTNTLGVYLGNPLLDPLMEKLNELKCTVLIHPTTPSSIPDGVNENLPIPAMEFFFDTTRTVTNMIQNDIFNRYPEIKWVIPHAGAFLGILSDRLAGFEPMLDISEKRKIDTMTNLNNLYYDVAGFSVPKQLDVLLKITSLDHLVYGSDAPYTPTVTCIQQAEALEKTTTFTEEDRIKVFRKNYLKLFPTLEGK